MALLVSVSFPPLLLHNNDDDNRYVHAEAAVVAVAPLKYDLVVTRIFEEGERELEEEQTSSGSSTEKPVENFVFPIGDPLHLSAEPTEGQPHPLFTWQHTVPGGLRRYRFEPSEETSGHMIRAFVFSLGRAVFESSRNKPSEGVPEAEIVALLEPGAKGPPKTPQKPAPAPSASAAPAPAPATPEQKMYPKLTPGKVAPAPAPAVPATPEANPMIPASRFHEMVAPSVARTRPPAAPVQGVQGETLVRVQADLFLFDEASRTFMVQQTGVSAAIQRLERFKFGLFMIGQGGQVLVGQHICNEIFPFFNMREMSIIWMYRLNTDVWTWSAKFANHDDDIAFKDTFARCLYEATKQEPFEKVKEEDKGVLLATMRDEISEESSSIMEEDDGMTEEDLKEFEDMDVDGGKEEPEEEEEDEEEAPSAAAGKPREMNKLLAVSGKHHRALVVRGSQIGVFSTTEEKKLKFETRISQIKDSRGATFSPRRIMLHQGEESLMMLHPDSHQKVLRMDLNRGDVVEEWVAHESYPVNELLPQDKYAPQAQTTSLVGMNRVGFFVVDPRQSGTAKAVQSKSFFSLGRAAPGFTCGATTTTGQLAMGTEKGEIRLYDHKMLTQGSRETDMESRQPRSKTTYPGFGDPVVGIDVTGDGRWVLATCRTYLLLIPAEDAEGKNGFEKPLGKTKPVPRRLQVKPEHIRLMGGVVNFTPAKFNQGVDRESAIVTSSGPFVITWNFRKAKQNILDHYQISRLGSDVVADQFRFGDADTVVVAMPDDVTLARKVLPKQH